MAISSRDDESAWSAPRDARADGAHADWLAETRFRYVAPYPQQPVWIPLLIQLRDKVGTVDGMTAQQFATYTWAEAVGGAEAARKWIQIPAMYATPPTNLAQNRFLTAMVTEEFFAFKESVAALREAIEQYEIGAAYLFPFDSIAKPLAPLDEEAVKHVVTAIIDDGFAFAHRRFRRRDGSSRIAFLWDQDDPSTVPFIGYGREITGADIPAAAGVGDDEEAIYRSLGFLDYSQSGFKPLGRRFSHGTSALDLAYGLDPDMVDPHTRLPIIAVKLPNRVTENPSDLSLEPWVFAAFFYILVRADDIALAERSAPLPVVVNMSYAVNHGPHDGTSLLERAIDALVELRTAGSNPVALTVVLPAGNARLSRWHASVVLPGTGVPAQLPWRVLPDDAASSWTYLYVAPGAHHPQPKVEVAITDPLGRKSAFVQRGQLTVLTVDGLVVALLVDSPPFPGRLDAIAIWVAPTTSLDGALPVAPSGEWTIEVVNRGGECVVDAWIRRGESPPGHPRAGFQSYFDDRSYVRFDPTAHPNETDGTGFCVRRTTISGMATGDRTVVAGGARKPTQDAHPDSYRAARYSGAAPVRGLRTNCDPDVTAVSEDGDTLHGVLTSGTRSGSVVAVNGTSVAAPQVARAAWMLLAATGHATRADIRGLAVATPDVLPECRGAGCVEATPIAPPFGIRR